MLVTCIRLKIYKASLIRGNKTDRKLLFNEKRNVLSVLRFPFLRGFTNLDFPLTADLGWADS